MEDIERIGRLIQAAIDNTDRIEPQFEILRDADCGNEDPRDDRVWFWVRDFDMNLDGQRFVDVEGSAEEVARKLAEYLGDEDIAISKHITRGYVDFQIGTLRDAVLLRDRLTKLIESHGEEFDYVMEDGPME
jgi:hypothetical protein